MQADEKDALDGWVSGEPGNTVPCGKVKGLEGKVGNGERDSSDKGSVGKPSINSTSLGIPSIVILFFIPVSNIFVEFIGSGGETIER